MQTIVLEQNIFKTNELAQEAVTQKIRVTIRATNVFTRHIDIFV